MLGADEGVIVGSLARSDCIAAITPWRAAGGGLESIAMVARRLTPFGLVRSSSTSPTLRGPSPPVAIVSAHARQSRSFTAQVSAGAITSTRSLITRLRNVVGSRSSPRQGSAITVISAPCPFRVRLPGVTDTGIRTRLSE